MLHIHNLNNLSAAELSVVSAIFTIGLVTTAIALAALGFLWGRAIKRLWYRLSTMRGPIHPTQQVVLARYTDDANNSLEAQIVRQWPVRLFGIYLSGGGWEPSWHFGICRIGGDTHKRSQLIRRVDAAIIAKEDHFAEVTDMAASDNNSESNDD